MNKRWLALTGVFLGTFVVLGCYTSPMTSEPLQSKPGPPIPKDASTLVVAGGCFWCLESQFELLRGVYAVESGYAGGDSPNATYRAIGGSAEAVKVFFDAKQISRADLLHIFFTIHDPTTLNRQGPDTGLQYRSAIFYSSDAERTLAEKIAAEIASEKIWPNPLVTSIEPLKNYARAEEDHQDYYEKFATGSTSQKTRMNGGYCTAIIEPKVSKFRQKYAHLLKKS